MTVTAGVAAGNVILRFACGCCAIVAGGAGAGYIAVIKICRRPGAGAMAIIAGRAALYMHWCFASGIDAVMTAYALCRDIAVVKFRRNPGNS